MCAEGEEAENSEQWPSAEVPTSVPDGDGGVTGTEADAGLCAQHVPHQSGVACWFLVFIDVNRLPGGRGWTGQPGAWLCVGQEMCSSCPEASWRREEPGLGAGPRAPPQRTLTGTREHILTPNLCQIGRTFPS